MIRKFMVNSQMYVEKVVPHLLVLDGGKIPHGMTSSLLITPFQVGLQYIGVKRVALPWL